MHPESTQKRTYSFSITVIFIILVGTQVAYAKFVDPPVHSDKWTDKYDRHFRKYSKRYFGPLFDWRWFKAQAIAESGLNKNAKSEAGARGLMQIMPTTLTEISRKHPDLSKLDAPHWNIAAGIYYDRTLYRKFTNAPEQDKLYMTFASYNAGYRRILKASKKSGSKEITWQNIKKHVPSETRSYVSRIRKLMQDDK